MRLNCVVILVLWPLCVHIKADIFEDATRSMYAHVFSIKQEDALGERSNNLKERDAIATQREVNARRLENIKTVCEQYNIDTKFRRRLMSGTAFVTEDPPLVYCFIPKAGCTYWKQILRYITGDFDQTADIASPEDIPRMHAHFGKWKHARRVTLTKEFNIQNLSNSGYRFMFSRDPYSRLWSGYLDKFYLPDFWMLFGRKIVHAIRPEADNISTKCGNDLTFSEFIKYVVMRQKNGLGIDMHFSPISGRCNPCKMQFDAIGKVETFKDDTNMILRDANVSLANWHTRQNVDRSLEEIKMLILYNFDGQRRWVNSNNRECFPQQEIAKRLWKTFQYNGYLGIEHKFPTEKVEEKGDKESIKMFLLELLTDIRSSTSDQKKKFWQNQREMFLHMAFMDVPRDIKEDLRDIYQKDFELFGYEKEPVSVFPE